MSRVSAVLVCLVIGLISACSSAAADDDSCPNKVTEPKRYVYRISLVQPDGTTTPEGVATAIDESGYLVTAGHIANKRTSKDQKLVAQLGNGPSLELENVRVSNIESGSDWAILKIKKSKPIAEVDGLYYQVPGSFDYAATDARIYSPRLPSGMIISETRVSPFENSQSASSSDYLLCPSNHFILVKTDGEYVYGDSGSPVLDRCHRLMGITSGWLEEPFNTAKDYIGIWYELTKALEVVAKGDINKTEIPVVGDSINNLTSLEKMQKKERDEAIRSVRTRWLQLISAYQKAHYVVITPVSCIANEVTADIEANPSDLKDATTGTDDLLKAVGEMLDGNFSLETIKSINADRVSLIDLSRLITATRGLNPFDPSGSEFEEDFEKDVIDRNGAKQLYKDFRFYVSSNFYNSFRDYVETSRNYVKNNYEQSRKIAQFVNFNTKSVGFDSGGIDEGRAAGVLIQEGQERLRRVPSPPAGRQPYVIGRAVLTDLDEAILKLVSGAIQLPPPAQASAHMRKYASTAYADLALALYYRRKFKTQASRVPDELVATEMKAAKIALLYNFRTVVAWDVASRAFFDIGSTTEAWYLAGVAMQARCGADCRSEFRNGDAYASQLYSNIDAFYAKMVEKGFEEDLIDIVEQLKTGELTQEAGQQAKKDWIVSLLQQLAAESSIVSQCMICPPVPVIEGHKDDLNPALAKSFDVVNSIGLGDWVNIWRGKAD